MPSAEQIEFDAGAERVYIKDAAEILNRRISTLRKWENDGILPPHLRPHRGYRDWRYWTPEQIEAIKVWMVETDRRPGRGLPHYKPDAERTQRHLDKLRGPRQKPEVAVAADEEDED